MYYNQGLNQQQIADRLHLSRPKVSRLLKEAREVGIVQISVVSPNNSFVDIEKSLEEQYDLKEVMIVDVDNQASGSVLKRQIGSAAANYFQRTISAEETIGMTWGTTLQAMVDAMPPISADRLHIVQTLGGVGPPEAKAHASDISKRVSQLTKSHLTLLPAPGIVGSKQAKEVLLSDRQVKKALDIFSNINTLYVGLGALKTNPVLNKSNKEIPPALQDEINHSNAVGDIALRFFDCDGKEVESKLNELIIGITVEEIKQVDTVVGIAAGEMKEDVIYGALNGKLIDVLITDSKTAKELLEKE